MRGHLEDAGLRVVQTPSRAPNANAHAERFVWSITEECLDRLVPLGEQHFRRAIAEYVAHDDAERPCPSRIRCQAATGSWTKSRQWETERTLFSSARATHVSAGEGQQRVALQRRVAADLVVVGQTPGAT